MDLGRRLVADDGTYAVLTRSARFCDARMPRVPAHAVTRDQTEPTRQQLPQRPTRRTPPTKGLPAAPRFLPACALLRAVEDLTTCVCQSHADCFVALNQVVHLGDIYFESCIGKPVNIVWAVFSYMILLTEDS